MAENIETGPPSTGNLEEVGQKYQTDLPKKAENRKHHRSRGSRGRNPRMDVQYRDSHEGHHRHGGYDDRYYDHVRSHGSHNRGRGHYKRGGSGRQHKWKQEANGSNTAIDPPEPTNETQGIEGKEQLDKNSQTESKYSHSKTTPTSTNPKESVVVVKQVNRRPFKPRHDPSTDETHYRPNRRGQYYKKRDIATTLPATLQSNELAQHLTAGTYECMICCDKVKARHEIWGCPCCYHLFHLRCISRWARSPAAAVNEGNHEEGWRCPGCQNSSVVVPSVYKCFCGRVTDPGKKRGRGDMTVPHSCGELCLKKLATQENDSCRHKCHQLCHPGPCPPCPVTVLRYCPCGKSSSRVRCSQFKILPSCGEVCGKKLNCTQHYCQQTCHEGECLSCTVDFEIACFCKREKKNFKCGEISMDNEGVSKDGYSCKRMCKKLLSCGNHTCEEACHIGDCSPCALLPSAVTHCPCGATPINRLLPNGTSRTSCLDGIPTCNKQCLKPQPCSTKDSIHLCQAMCHVSDCPPCTSMSLAVCQCGRSTLKVPCTEVQDKTGFTCNRVCRKPLSCGRHKCQTKCCVSDDHQCRRVCGRKFSCGLHTCPDICHPHGCGQCWNISYEELTCHCGKEVLLPPIHCGTTPPACSAPCARPHPCDHPITHTCHNDETCPPCTFLTEKLCMGGHTTRRSIPCHLKDISCGMPCGKPLPCDMHSCRKTCHKGACQSEGEVCKQLCTRERRYCSHPCSAPCHPGSPCPDTACNAKVELKCACGYRTESTRCLASSTDVMTVAFQKLHQRDFGSLLRELQSGHSVQVDSISLQNIKERRLDCNEECALFERNRKLAEALDISDPDFSPNISPQYSCFLLEQAREHREFIESLETSLKQLVTAAQQSSSYDTTCKHSFKPMKKNQRHIIHELAPYYGCTTASYDPEPQRSVVVMATNKSFVPAVLLSRSCSTGGEISGKTRLMPPPVAMKLPPTASNRLSPEPQSQSNTIPDYFNDENL